MDEAIFRFFQSAEAWAYYGVTAVVAAVEMVKPRRPLAMDLRARWLGNIVFAVLNNVLILWILPLTAILFAFALQDRGWGLFNIIDLPYWLAFVLTFLLMDLSFYLKHRLAHAVPVLWRIHRLHHSDGDFDFTTSLRFHPFDVAYQIALQFLTILVIGATPGGLAAHILIFMIWARLQHANIEWPASVEHTLRRVFVTGDLHRVHHSARQVETDSNYGGVLPWWDRLLGTYTEQPAGGHQGMAVGLEGYQDPKYATVGWMLADPFLNPKAPGSGSDIAEATLAAAPTTEGTSSQ